MTTTSRLSIGTSATQVTPASRSSGHGAADPRTLLHGELAERTGLSPENREPAPTGRRCQTPFRSTRGEGLLSKQQPHLDGVPELAALAAVVPDAPALLDELELPVQREPGGVVGEHAEAQLVQAALARPLDRCLH
jgi:hypothetical protein